METAGDYPSVIDDGKELKMFLGDGTRVDVSSLAGKAVRLHLVMRGTKLYAFQFVTVAKEP